MRVVAFLSLIVLSIGALEAADRKGKKPPKAKVDKLALKKLKDADKLVYRPLSKGLKDISFEFVVPTIEGKLTCVWAFRKGTKKLPERIARTVTSRQGGPKGSSSALDRKARRRYAASLKEYFTLVAWPILITPFADAAKDMNVEWKDQRGGMTILTPLPDKKWRWDKITYVWNENGRPREIAWLQMKEDEEGPYRVELTMTIEWKQEGKLWVVSQLNTNRWGSTVVYEYSYTKVKGVLLPTKTKRINPFAGIEDLALANVKVNEGISDEQFSSWR